MNDLHLLVVVLALQRKAKLLVLPHNPSFQASMDSSIQRHDSSLCKRTSLCQNFPSQRESKMSSFHSECAKFLKIGKYPFLLIGNMDKTLFFDMVPQRSLVPTGKKTSGSEKRHATAVLTVAATVPQVIES